MTGKFQVFKCRGGRGCHKSKKDGCEISIRGKIPECSESGLYICPYNHWRSAKWVEVKKRKPNAEAHGTRSPRTVKPLVRHLDLFSGIGGFALACRMVGGIQTVAFCERDQYCQKVLAKHWPDVPICNDIHDLKGTEYGTVDIVTGGFPCQPYSTSGKRKGRADERSLWHELVRVVSIAKPSWVIGENVAGFTSMDLDDLCDALEQEGYETQPMLIPACAVGAAHIRQRCWILAHLRTGDARQGMESVAGAGRGDGSRGEADVPSADRGLGDAFGNEANRNDIRSNQDRWRELERGVGGIVYGIRHRPHRFRGLGNAIVWQVAAEIIGAMMRVGGTTGNER